MSRLSALFLREWRIARRIGGSGAMGVVFFLILVATYPFAVGPDAALWDLDDDDYGDDGSRAS